MNYQEINAAIDAVIFDNTEGAITADKMNTILKRIVSTLGAGARFVGIATPELVPPTPDNIVFYMATTAGEYPNFGEGVILDGKTLHLFVSGLEEGWVDIPTSVSVGGTQVESYEISYDRYLIIPWENPAVLAITTEVVGEEITSQPFFVALGGGECKITTIDRDGLAVEFFSGTIDSKPQLALYNISGEEQISVKAHVLLLGGEMPEMIIGQDTDFDDDPEVFRDVNGFARHIEMSVRWDGDMDWIRDVDTNVVRDNPTADIVLIYEREGLCYDRITYVELDQNGDINIIKTASGREVEI